MKLGVIADWLLGLASFFKDNDSVGLIIFIFLCALIVSVARTFFGDLYKNFCLRLAGERLREGRAGARDIDDKWRAIADARAFLARYEFPQVQAQWALFEAVLGTDTRQNLKSDVEVHQIFTGERLGMVPGKWYTLSRLFVSAGLLLTFLGLVAVLQETGQAIRQALAEQNDVQSALADLLSIASGKFLISLTGLFCSIILNLTIEARKSVNQRDIDGFTGELEALARYVPSERTLSEMLEELSRRERGEARDV